MGQVVIGSRVSLLVVGLRVFEEHADDRRECRDEADCPPCLKAASGSFACLNSVHVRSSSAFCRTVLLSVFVLLCFLRAHSPPFQRLVDRSGQSARILCLLAAGNAQIVRL
ncbi:hypothetical protein T02_2555 [Trichinella nativa]|nr:hypothetical protein T02_2555 [Trichinella nativa]KRZ90240.1 hypothetical protein T08_15257 [Trichinella sp. T8]